MKETYLGDGLYASQDGWQIRLRAPRDGGDHEIFMEPDVLMNFLGFVDASCGLKIRVEKRKESEATLNANS